MSLAELDIMDKLMAIIEAQAQEIEDLKTCLRPAPPVQPPADQASLHVPHEGK